MKEDFLSVIVPAYKQEKTIVKDLRNIESVLKTMNCDYEIICVVDGKVDRTYEKASRINSSKIKSYLYRENHGKGYAVRYGMARSRGNIVAFLDSGMDINPQGIPLLLEHMRWYDSDIIVGSIRHSASKVIGYPLKRKIFSIGYHLFTRLVFGLNITDSQRGLKIFKRGVLEKVLPRLMVKRFAFDIEMLSVARLLGYKKIHDGPVEMDARRFKYSSIKSSTVLSMFRDTLAVFYRLKIINYYSGKNRKKWVYDKDLQMRISVAV